MSDTPFDIQNAPGFDPVADAFMDNFERGEELAAGFCAFQDDTCLVDMVGGWADRAQTTPFTRDNLVAIFSSGKTAAALVIAWLAEQDRLGYDQPVKSIWPEFDQHGKGDLTVAQIMSHQSGLSGITDPDWTAEDWFDWDKTCAQLAAQEPIWEPGTASGYHPVTFGFLAGEIARRTDAHGRMLGRILREEFCAPHDLDIWIGLPEAHLERAAYMRRPRAAAKFGPLNEATRTAFLQNNSSPGGARTREDWMMAEFAGSNCHATARSMARLLQMPLTGKIGGTSYLSEDTLTQLHKPRISGRNLVLPFDITFAAGFMKNAPNFYFGPNAETLGHSGWGGSCVFADPETGITGCYAMTRQDSSLLGDERPRRIVDALYGCL